MGFELYNYVFFTAVLNLYISYHLKLITYRPMKKHMEMQCDMGDH